MSKKVIVWWLVFISAALPSIILFGRFIFDPRSLGVDPIEVILQESGEWALRFLLISLSCSPLKRLGWKGILKYRRMLGLYSFYYATMHLSTYLVGWIALDWVAFLEDVYKRPFIYLGMTGWSILFLLAITSPKIMVRRLKKNWSRVHKLVYVAIIVVWVHLWMQSRASAGEAVLYGCVALALLGERLFQKYKKISPASR